MACKVKKICLKKLPLYLTEKSDILIQMPKSPDRATQIFVPPTAEALSKFRKSFENSMERAEEIQRQLRVKSAQIGLPSTPSSLDIIINVPPRIN